LKTIKSLIIAIFFSFNAFADIEDEIYEPDFEDNKIKKKELIYEQDIQFSKLMTCIFKKDEFRRIFRFGITTGDKFFYRQKLTLNNEIDGFAKEKIFLIKKKENYLLKIKTRTETLDLEINFDEKKSNLLRKSHLIKVNCR
tara:strand:+ start:583 stop:1005 length:423 start_codon:yes stop_codon:yes gene_type:complete